MGWLRIASHLGLSLQRVKRETTASEYGLWLVYLEHEVNSFHREDYYWAKMNMLLEMSIAKEPSKVKFELLKFETDKKTEEQKQAEKMNKSKVAWAKLFGEEPCS